MLDERARAHRGCRLGEHPAFHPALAGLDPDIHSLAVADAPFHERT